MPLPSLLSTPAFQSPTIEDLICKGGWEDEPDCPGRTAIYLDGRVHLDGVRAVELGDALDKIAELLGKEEAVFFTIFHEHPPRKEGPLRTPQSREETRDARTCKHIERGFLVVVDKEVLGYAQRALEPVIDPIEVRSPIRIVPSFRGGRHGGHRARRQNTL